MVRLMKERREDDVVRGSRGNRVLRSLHPSCERARYVRHRGGAHSMEVITSLFRNMTKFCTKDFRVSGESVP